MSGSKEYPLGKSRESSPVLDKKFPKEQTSQCNNHYMEYRSSHWILRRDFKAEFLPKNSLDRQYAHFMRCQSDWSGQSLRHLMNGIFLRHALRTEWKENEEWWFSFSVQSALQCKQVGLIAILPIEEEVWLTICAHAADVLEQLNAFTISTRWRAVSMDCYLHTWHTS